MAPAKTSGWVLSGVLLLAGCAHLPGHERDETGDDSAERETDDDAAYLIAHTDALFPLIDLGPAPRVTGVEESGARYDDDLWARIRRGYDIDADMDRPRVTAEMDRYGRDGSYMRRISERAEPYLHHIVEGLEERDMPLELAMLPAVESAFQPMAYSHGNASGIWQFVPVTARHYNLERTWWYDGRRDVIASTEAALDYLERLEELFDGDWLLALAAYNAGEGRVMAAIRQAEAQGEPTDYWNLSLPRETRYYVPRLLAVSALVKDPDAYELELASIPDEPYFEVVDPGGQIDLSLAAEMAEVDMDVIEYLNPGLDRWATDPDGPHHLALPAERVEDFRAALDEHGDDELVRWARHEVRPGDNLGAIARAHNTTVDALRRANDIDGTMIREGSHLLVPRDGDGGDTPVDAGGSAQQAEYTVQTGDTLWDIARAHGVSVSELTAWNDLSAGEMLRPGETLELQVDGGGVTQAGGSAGGASGRVQEVQYRVRSGDNLYAIANRFGVSVDHIRRRNDLEPGAYLQPGDRLSLKVDVRNRESI